MFRQKEQTNTKRNEGYGFIATEVMTWKSFSTRKTAMRCCKNVKAFEFFVSDICQYSDQVLIGVLM
ncbi:MAG: hypothetical protein LBJ78_03320 [Puniceicoccales bacterium]|nr:hypothetical protein [Puniceicoccales bacterium]